jgi:hypothetical protein
MKISISIMAHPSRAEWVAGLTDRLGDVPVSWDQNGVEWDTGAAAWRLYDPSAEWHVVLQDDALVCDQFMSRLKDVLAEAPQEGPVSLYLGQGRPKSHQPMIRSRTRRADDGWVRLPWLLWGVAVALPVAHIEHMLRVAAKLPIAEYDTRISRVYEICRPGIKVLHSWPSLVDHRDDGSLLGHDDVPRKAYWWIDE